MDVPSLWYLCFWAIVSVLALTSVRVLLNKVDEFRHHSSELQLLLTSFFCFSLCYAFLFIPSLKRRYSGAALPIWCYVYLNLMLTFSLIYMLRDDSPNWLLILGVSTLVPPFFVVSLYAIYLFSVSGAAPMHFFHRFPWLVFTALTTIINQDEHHTIKIEFHYPFLPCVVAPSMAYLLFVYQSKLQSPASIKIPSSIKIIVGVIGNIVANHYLKDKSILLFWLLLSLSIFWLGNIAMMQSSCQAGIFGFLVGAVLDIAGDIFGLNIYMWLVGFGCAVIFIFFEHLDEFNLRYPGAEEEEMPTPTPGPTAQLELTRRRASRGDRILTV